MESKRDVLREFGEYVEGVGNKGDISGLDTYIRYKRIKSINVYDKEKCWDITGQLPGGLWMYLEEWMQSMGYVYYYSRRNFEEDKKKREEKQLKRQVMFELLEHLSKYDSSSKMSVEKVREEIRKFVEDGIK